MEVQNFTMLNEIDVLKTSPSTVKVRVLRVWSVKDNKNANEDFLMEMVLIDQSRIECKLRFSNPTFVVSKDVIGHVVHIFKSNWSNFKYKNKRTMEISDLSGNCVCLTLWDDYASQLSKYVINHFEESQAIILLQFGRVKYYTGFNNKEKVYISNSFGSGVSRMFINDYLFEIEEYKNRLFGLLNGNDVNICRPIPVKLLSSLDDEFLKTSFYNICEICTILVPKSIILLGTIKAICPDTDWYYIGCSTSSRKLIVNVVEGGNAYECKNTRCNTLGVVPTLRDAKLLINKPASDLIVVEDENGIARGGFPIELNKKMCTADVNSPASKQKERRLILDGKRSASKDLTKNASQNSSSSRIIKSNVNVAANMSNTLRYSSRVVKDIAEPSSTVRKRQRKLTSIEPVRMSDLNEHATVFSDENVVGVFKGISSEYLDHGNQSVMCPSCNAFLWKAEVKGGKKSNVDGGFSPCCYNGKVELSDVRQPDESYIQLFRGQSAMSKYFLKNIRRFNSMFSFTSMGGKIDNSLNRGNAPYTFRLSGENYHCLGSLLPLDGRKPQFAQLYIYDTENEISNRQSVFSDTKKMVNNQENDIINYLKTMLDSHNHLVQAYRMVRDCFQQNPQMDLKLRIIGTRQYDARTYNLPSASEVVALIVGDISDAVDNRDIIVTKKCGTLKCISELHPSYVPLQYPLFYPFGEDGYQVNILHKNVTSSSTAKRKKVTMREFFAYRIQDRPNKFSVTLNGRRLFQQMLVDEYTMIEAQRLHYIRAKQHDLRCDTYESLRGIQSTGNTDLSTVEVKRFLKDTTLKSKDRPDILCRLFKLKLDSMIKELKEKSLFGKVQAEKRVPQAHICMFMHAESKIHNPQLIDNFISAEIPNKNKNTNPKCTCMICLACEATWRIFAFDVHYRLPSVMRLTFHLPGEHQVIYGADDDIEDVLNKTTNAYSLFTSWFECNKKYESASHLTYSEFPTKFTFEQLMELFVILLERHDTRGLLDDDKEYIEAIQEASYTSTGYYLRHLFATMLITYSLSRPYFVSESTWQLLLDGILYKQQNDQNNSESSLNEEQLKNLALLEIEIFLVSNNSTLRKYKEMPFPDKDSISRATNPLMVEELSYDTETMSNEFNHLFNSLTDEQQVVFNEIMNSLVAKRGGVFFVYGYGGTGKTYLWKTLSASIRSKREVVLNVAYSGIASLLLEGGRTTHSRFLIPINLTEDSQCPVKGNTDVYEILKKTTLVIWDEEPMIHKHAFEALDRTLKDVMAGDPANTLEALFRGKVVVFGGDFRQILLVVTNGTRSEFVNASINSLYIWSKCKLLKLTKNMRLTVGCGSSNLEEIKEFADWLLDIGEGNVGGPNDGESIVKIPNDLLILNSLDPIGDLIQFVYPNMLDRFNKVTYFQDRALLAPLNEVVQVINERMLALFLGDEVEYLSFDSLDQAETVSDNVDPPIVLF
ncbi:uncharacterized protein LOC143551635 [Bidens hawaiensis]|uniref:uncharacterized protein LOC143551635 n=1 Tax=Bidens hawaiensis TaxID=980011 RepID=UPI00404B0E6E